VKFLHVADIHLGFEQYGVRERFNDFSRTFLWLMDFAREQEVDFVLLAGGSRVLSHRMPRHRHRGEPREGLLH